MSDTITVIDNERVGKKGFPMHSAAYPNAALPTKEVPVSESGGEQPIEPLTPEQARQLMPPITKRQLRLTLVRNGISLAQVEQSIAAMPDGLEKQEAEIEWQDASEFNRLHPTLLLIAEYLSLTPEQVDEMWSYASEI